MSANDALRERSGAVKGADKVQALLYDLMRDHISPGIIEELVRASEEHTEYLYSNGWLAAYAEDLSNRLQ